MSSNRGANNMGPSPHKIQGRATLIVFGDLRYADWVVDPHGGSMTAMVALLISLISPAFAQQSFPFPEFSRREVQSAQRDPLAYTVNPKSVRFVKLGPSVAVQRGADPAPEDPLPGIDPDQLINIGKQIWQIILDNAPVVDVKVGYAAAVPKGVDHWTQLAGWQPPQGTVYEFCAENMYGVKTVEVKFQVMRTAGGNFNGKGKYLTNVTVDPLLISVGWGYKVSMEASVAPESIANVGSTEDPIAAMVAGLRWSIHTPVKEIDGRSLYYLQGDGVFKELGGPFRNQGIEDAKASVQTLRIPLAWD